ncbi:MAG TPA: TonB-dependent receptor [Bacteroidetes bacterium]|nr:TonB-dependent receptor [Bacteroidota bacterium]
MKQLFVMILFFISLGLYGQRLTVTGTVTEESTGESIPGVAVVIKGTTFGTTTDSNGQYSIEASVNDVLVFSFLGMQTREVTVTSSRIDVALVPELIDLEEVVVTGYGIQKKALITGANQNVKGEQIAELNTGTAMEALQGLTPGVSITRNNGQPGAGTKVHIRGMGTIYDADPLYIVDGVPVGNIDYLNPSDIESVDILKDAASAAIYGARAANGVILVTTSKGERGTRPMVRYDTYYGLQNIYRNLTPLTAQEYMYIMDEGRVNDGLEPYDWETMLKNNSWLNNNFPDDLGTQLGEEIWAMLQDGWEGTNWINEITKEDAPMVSHALSVTGGSSNVIYSLGFSYLDQTGIIAGDLIDAGLKRMTARINTEYILYRADDYDIIKVGENFTYTNNVNRSVGTGNIYWNDLHDALVINPLMPAYWDKSPDPHGFTPILEGISNNQTNPLATCFYRHNYGWYKGNDIKGNVYAEIQPIKNLVYRSAFGIDAWFGSGRSWSPTYALGTLYSNPKDAVNQNMYFGNNWTWTNTLTYDLHLGDHRITALVGNELYKNQINREVGGWMADSRFQDPDYAYLNNVDKSDVNSISTWGADWAAGGGGIMSYIGRLQYNFREKYLFTAIMRADGSSNFAEGKRWGTFPSVAVGWVISEEDFMIGTSDMLNFAKLRASWGQNGNQSIDNFIYSSTIRYLSPGYYFGESKTVSQPTAVPARVTNPDVTWETSEQLNIGLDARLFNHRMSLTFDWYRKMTRDWLVVAPILGTAGADAPWINGGDIMNRGFEVSVGWDDSFGDLNYGISVMGAHNHNEITRIANADGIIHGPAHVLSQGTAAISRCEVGYPIGYFYGFETDGILQNQDDVDAYVTPEGTPYFSDQRPGDIKFVDQNLDGVIDEQDKVMIGDPNPDFELGMQLHADYKGIYASATLTGRFGMQVARSYRSFADNFDQNYTTDIFNRWHGEGTSDRIPRLSSSSHRNTNFISDIYIHDADYLRISNLTVGYMLDDLLRDFNAVSSAKVYVAFKNLHTFTKYDGMDPEVSFGHDASWASGIDLGLYPQARTVMFGLSVSF